MIGIAGQSKDAVKKYLDADGAFEKARIAARNNTMTQYFTSSDFATRPSEALGKLRSGDAGVFSSVWSRMDEAERDGVVQTMLKRQADELQIIDRDDKLSNLRNRAANFEDYNQFYGGTIGGDELIRRMVDRGYTPGREELKQIREGDVPGAPDSYFGALEYKARLGQMGMAEANSLFESRRISLKQRNTLFGLIDKTERPDIQSAKDYITNSFVANPLDPSTKQGNERKAEVTNQLLGMIDVARRDGKSFDVFSAAQQLVAARKKSADYQTLEADRALLKRRLDDLGLVYKEDYTDESLSRAGVDSKENRKRITNLISEIKKRQ
jgi:hypothetical protein